MKKTKIFTVLALSGVIAVGGAIIGKQTKQLKELHAASCLHEHAEYYDGYTNLASVYSCVEHWACCQCHTAWADANKTVEIGNTIDDRSVLDFDYGFVINWGRGFMTPTYGGQGVTEFTDSSFSIASGGEDPYYFVAIEGTKTLANNEYATLTILNSSTADSLNVQILDGNWGEFGVDIQTCNKNVEKVVEFSSAQWNAKPVFIIKEPSKAETTGTFKFKLEFKKSSFVGDNDTNVYAGCAINSSLNDWASFTKTGNDGEYGEYKIVDIANAPASSFDIIVNGTGALTAGTYSAVKFALYNPTELNIGLQAFMSDSAWGSLVSENCGILVPGWNVVYIDAGKLENSATNFISLRLNLSGGGNVDGWRISKFYATPLIRTLTSYHFGQISDTGEDDATYGNIYNLVQEQWFIDNPNSGTMASAGTGVLRAQLPSGKFALEFAIYNPTENVNNFHVDGGDPWRGGTSVNLAPQAWTVVSLSTVDFEINDSGTVYFYASNCDVVGWKVTDIWAK